MTFNIINRLANIFHVVIFYLHMSKTLCFVHKIHQTCNEMPEDALEEILGSSYNWRYMSINKPIILNDFNIDSKRAILYDTENVGKENHMAKLTAKPAWEIRNHVNIRTESATPLPRQRKRQLPPTEEWHCRSVNVWEDLGPDYFPRYVHNLKCVSSNCWFTRLKCKTRSFALKILTKQHGECAVIGPETLIAFAGQERKLRQVWIWKEIPINFCCECTV